jgi:hypothetical protein
MEKRIHLRFRAKNERSVDGLLAADAIFLYGAEEKCCKEK